MAMPTAIRKTNVLVILFKGCNILYIIEHLFRYAVPFRYVSYMIEDEISQEICLKIFNGAKHCILCQVFI